MRDGRRLLTVAVTIGLFSVVLVSTVRCTSIFVSLDSWMRTCAKGGITVKFINLYNCSAFAAMWLRQYSSDSRFGVLLACFGWQRVYKIIGLAYQALHNANSLWVLHSCASPNFRQTRRLRPTNRSSCDRTLKCWQSLIPDHCCTCWKGSTDWHYFISLGTNFHTTFQNLFVPHVSSKFYLVLFRISTNSLQRTCLLPGSFWKNVIVLL